jgi:esterase/lipase
MKYKITIAVAIMLLILSCGTKEQQTEQKDANDLIFTTADEVNITGKYTEIDTSRKAVLLLHMVGRDKSDYDNLTPYLLYNGYTVLALDFRGHGNSDLDYAQFTEQDWQNLVLDVEAGLDFLEKRGYSNVAVIGASIGANVGFKHAVQDRRIRALVLLSAGEEYHGVNILELAEFYDRPVLFVASLDDKDAAVAATKIYNAAGTEYKEIKMYQSGGHGTDILAAQDGLPAIMLTWLQKYYG